jgi:hypothetical protein
MNDRHNGTSEGSSVQAREREIQRTRATQVVGLPYSYTDLVLGTAPALSQPTPPETRVRIYVPLRHYQQG